MSEIKQINTGVAELLAYLLPIDTTSYDTISFPGYLSTYQSCCQSDEHIKLPAGNWTPLGIDTELTEEQWSELFIKGGNESFGELYKVNDLFYAKAIKAGVALLKANVINGPHLILKRL